MQIVDMRPDHLPDLARLCGELRLQPVDDVPTLRAATLDDPTSPSHLRLMAEENGGLVGFALGCLRPSGEGPGEDHGVIKLFGVAPTYQRRGIASALLDALEARLIAGGARRLSVAGVAPGWLFPGVEITHTAAISFLLARGYETDRNARVDMRVDLASSDWDTSAARTAFTRQGIALRRATPEDVESAVALIREQFSAAWEAEARAAARLQPSGLFVAMEGGRVVSFAAYGAAGPRRFGPTGTHPDHRRRGLGGALLRMCLADMRARGAEECEICWVGPIGFYARAVGAQIHRAYWCFGKPAAH